jgi:hypothetical protein
LRAATARSRLLSPFRRLASRSERLAGYRRGVESGPNWAHMRARPRKRLAERRISALPTSAGVYALWRGWLDDCEASWLVADDEAAALALEEAFKREWLPPLTKQ